MVNIEEFSKRLKIILDYYEITAASLADKIAVQRSSISHILSGRNKPSLEFVLKILNEFPEVELYWLLNGKGKFPALNVKKNDTTPTLFSESENMSKEGIITSQKIATTEIERIVIFYKDGTFKNYKP